MRVALGQLALVLFCCMAAAILSLGLTFVLLLLEIACRNLSLPWYIAGLMSSVYLLVNFEAHGRLKESDENPEWILSGFVALIGAPAVFYASLPWSFFLMSSCVN